MTVHDMGRASDEDAALDAMLAAWAARHSPSDEQLETARRAILREGEGTSDVALAEAVLPLEWWERFFDDLNSGMRRAASLDSLFSTLSASAA